MKKGLAFIFTIFIFGVVFVGGVSAQSYSGSTSFEVVVNENLTTSVKQDLVLSNQSNQFLISRLEFGLPFQVKDLKVTNNGIPLSARLNGRDLVINLGEKSIRLGDKRRLEVTYKVEGLVEDEGAFQGIRWPKFKFGTIESRGGVSIYYPDSWGDVSYSTKQFLPATNKFGLRGVKIPDFSEVFFMTGNPKAVKIHGEWAIPVVSETEETKTRIALPSPLIGKFQFLGNVGADLGYFDSRGNSFLVKTSGPTQISKGEFTGNYDFSEETLELTTTLDSFQLDIDYINQIKETTVENIYQDTLRRLEPSNTFEFSSRMGIKDTVLKQVHNSLDYANLLVAELRAIQVPAEIVYGYVYFPILDEYGWHYWALYESEGQIHHIDAYMQDLINIDQFTQVTPGRVPWGILASDDDGSDLGIQYIATDGLISYDYENVLGVDFDLSNIYVKLNLLDQAYSGVPLDLELTITNSSNSAVRISQINLAEFVLEQSDLAEFWLVPRSSITIPISTIVLEDPFFRGVKNISGNVLLSTQDGDKQISLSKDVSLIIDRNRLFTNFVVIFLSFVILSVGVKIFEPWRIFQKFPQREIDTKAKSIHN